jgi:outer membrane lipopolysaccharide assembly protein LptE/RlpB
VDEYEKTFGIRKIEFTADCGFHLNGNLTVSTITTTSARWR